MTSKKTCDVTGWIIVGCTAILALIVFAYIWSSNSQFIFQLIHSSDSESRRSFGKLLMLLAGLAFTLSFAIGVAEFLRFRRAVEQPVDDQTTFVSEEESTSDLNDDGSSSLYDDTVTSDRAAADITDDDFDGDLLKATVSEYTRHHKASTPASIGENEDEKDNGGPPAKALTRCIKVRGLIFDESDLESDEIRAALLRAMRPYTPQHVGFTLKPEKVVYVMIDDLECAKYLFDMFHAREFRGQLLNVKYLRERRYVERFPTAAVFLQSGVDQFLQSNTRGKAIQSADC